MDAECTHDGSIRHIQKFEHWGWESLDQRVLNAERTDNLTTLQVIDLLFYYLCVCGKIATLFICWDFSVEATTYFAP